MIQAGAVFIPVKPKPEGWGNLGRTVAIAAPLAAVAATAFKVGDEFNQMRKTIIVGTGASGTALKGLEASAKRVGRSTPSSFKDVGTAIADVNTRLGLTGKPLETMSKKFLNLSRVTGTDLATNIKDVSRVFGDWGVAIKDQPAALDKLFFTSQATGIGVDELSNKVVQFGAPMRQFGFSFEESAALMGKWHKEGVNTEVVMAGMKAGLGKLSKAGKDPVKAFAEIQAAIKGAGSVGEANAIAIETFGQRAGPDLAAAVREGRFELGDLVKSMDGSKGAIEDADKRTRTWRESLALLRNKAMVYIAPLADRLFDSINRGAGWLEKTAIPAVRRFTGAFQVLGGILAAGVAAWAAYAVAAKVSAGWTALHTVWTNRQAIAQKLLNKAMLLSPIGLVVGALAALGVGLVIAYKKSETFRRIVDKAWAGIKTAVKIAWDGYIKPALAAFGRFLTNVVAPAIRFLWRNVVAPTFRLIGSLIKTWWNVIVKPTFAALRFYFTKVLFPTIRFLWNHVVKPVFRAVADRIKTTWDIVRPILRAFGNFISDKVAPAFRRGVDAVERAWGRIRAIAAKPVNFVIETVYNNGLRKLFNTVADKLGMSASLPPVKPIGTGGAGRTAPAFGGASRNAHAHPEAMGGPFDFVKNAIGKPFGWLKDKVTGGLDGLLSRIGSGPFGDLAKGAARKVAGFATDFLKGKFSAAATATGPKGKAGRVLPAGSYRIGMPYLGYPGHYGADYPAPAGTPVSSPWAGRVVKVASLTSSYGKHIYVDHGNGVQTRYAHLSALGVKAGQQILPGGFLGRVGSTGNSTGPHLHFEYRRNGSPSNPAGLGIFDSGGMLPPGLSAVYNGTGKPEAVFTADQFKTLEQIANQGRAGGGQVGLRITNWADGTGYLEDLADGRVRAASEMADMLGRAD